MYIQVIECTKQINQIYTSGNVKVKIISNVRKLLPPKQRHRDQTVEEECINQSINYVKSQQHRIFLH